MGRAVLSGLIRGTRDTGWVHLALGAVGLLCGVACSVAMIIAATGLAGAVTSAAGALGQGSMSGMSGMGGSGQSTPPILRFLIDAGPTILIVSIVLLTLAAAVRRPLAAVPMVLVGGGLYWSMYSQSSVGIMDAGIAVGLLAWGSLLVWVFRGLRRTASQSRPTPPTDSGSAGGNARIC